MATIVPPDLRRVAEPVEALRSLPRLHVSPGVDAQTVDLDLIGTLGEGGMGIIRLARQTALDREVAVKTVREGARASAPQLLQEAYVTGALEHPNVIPVYTLGQDPDGLPLIVMKRIEGVSWLDVLRDASLAPRSEPADLMWHLEILLQVCNALRYAHSRSVIHRDIKPENVMIGRFGEVYLLDWGIAITTSDGFAERSRLPHRRDVRGVAGTPAYMAPEMTDNDAERQDERTDVFLLGATLHHVLTGAPPHRGKRLFDVMRSAFEGIEPVYPDSVPQSLGELARRAMSRERDARFDSVDAFSAAIRDFLDHRASIQLSVEAERSLERALDLLQRSGSLDRDATAVHDLFTECRFAARQSIREWPQNARARDVAFRCAREQVRFAVRQRDVIGAQAALAEIDDPPDELRAAVDSLVAELAREREDHERLRRFEEDLDLREGSIQRSVFALAVGIAWAATSFWSYYRVVIIEATDYDPVLGTARMTAIAAAGILLFRRRLFANIANRRLTYLLMFTLAVLVAYRILRHSFEIGQPAGVALELCFYAFGAAAAGLLADLRISLGSLLYLAATAAVIAYPDERGLVVGLAHIAFFGWVAFLWLPSQVDKRVIG